MADPRHLARDVRLQFLKKQLVYFAGRTLLQNCSVGFAVVHHPPGVGATGPNFGGDYIVGAARRSLVLAAHSRDGNIIARYDGVDGGVVGRLDDALVFVGSADKKTG